MAAVLLPQPLVSKTIPRPIMPVSMPLTIEKLSLVFCKIWAPLAIGENFVLSCRTNSCFCLSTSLRILGVGRGTLLTVLRILFFAFSVWLAPLEPTLILGAVGVAAVVGPGHVHGVAALQLVRREGQVRHRGAGLLHAALVHGEEPCEALLLLVLLPHLVQLQVHLLHLVLSFATKQILFGAIHDRRVPGGKDWISLSDLPVSRPPV
mmetsp:Transcript_10972/g.30837  ORF Transcript_10972/g.30837 Transcript_10972/m.30837 type:complete len:207 (-) Transcript_10972:1477-2097(-)